MVTAAYVIQGGDTKLSIDKSTGEIKQWSYGEELITSQPIRPNFWRAPTDNDLGNGMHNWAKIWKEATDEAVPVLNNAPQQVDHDAYTIPARAYHYSFVIQPNEKAQ